MKTKQDIEDAIRNLLGIISKFQDTEINQEFISEACDILDQASNELDEFLFDIEE